MADLEARFKKAVYLVRNGPPNPNTNTERKLAYYKYYKQATEGDVTGSQVWLKIISNLNTLKAVYRQYFFYVKKNKIQ